MVLAALPSRAGHYGHQARMGQGLLVVEHRIDIARERKPPGVSAAEPKALPHSIIATIFRFSLSGGGDDDGDGDGDDGGQL